MGRAAFAASWALGAVAVLVVLSGERVQGKCNATYYHKVWREDSYPSTGVLKRDLEFWRWDFEGQNTLTKGVALDKAATKCKEQFDLLKVSLAGRQGPVDEVFLYDVMCHDYCLENDALHLAASEESECSCLELSTQPDDPTFHIEGNFCRDNSARILCEEYGDCGIWECRIDDYMCPRHEFNKRFIQFRGLGDCGSATIHMPRAATALWTALLASAVAVLFNRFLSSS